MASRPPPRQSTTRQAPPVPQLVEALPDYLEEYADYDQSEFEVPDSQPIGRVSIEGKVWTMIYKGEVFDHIDTATGYAIPFLDVVIVKGHPATSRKWYEHGYERGSKDAPDCASIDGVKPDPASPNIQSNHCVSCRWARFGTAKAVGGGTGKGMACQQYKRLAVLPSGDPVNEILGGPMLLAVPPTSFKAFMAYIREMQRMGRPPHLCNTRMSFEPTVNHAQINFQYVGLVTRDEAAAIHDWRMAGTEGGEYVERLLRVQPAAETDDDKANLDPEVAPEEYEAQTVAAPPQPARRPVQQPPPAPNRAAAPAPRPAPRPAPQPAPRAAAPQPRPQPQPQPRPQARTAAPTRPAARPAPTGVAAGQPVRATAPQRPQLTRPTQQPMAQPVVQPATRATQAPAPVRRTVASAPAQAQAQVARPVPRPGNGLAGAPTSRPLARPTPQRAAPPPSNDEADMAEVDDILTGLGQDFEIPDN